MKLRLLLSGCLMLGVLINGHTQVFPQFISISKVDTSYIDSTSNSYSISHTNSILKVFQTKIPLKLNSYSQIKNSEYNPVTILFEGKLTNEGDKLIVMENNRKVMTLKFNETKESFSIYDNTLKELKGSDSFGIISLFYENGEPKYFGNYHNGKREGKWTFRDINGTVESKIYRKGIVVN